ncbi:MAG: hypothetical protein K1X57_23005 [Gemmataceae bacterium]|nr:hypothetical protein [Gemmataceae bacterium]
MTTSRRIHRAGQVSFDMVLCTATLLPIAAAMCAILKAGLYSFFQVLGATVGWPLM